MKQKYVVYYRHCQICADSEDYYQDGKWILLGYTYALSSEKAIANMKFRSGINTNFYDDGYNTVEYNEFKADVSD